MLPALPPPHSVRLVTAPHPFSPAAGRELRQAIVTPGESLAAMLKREAGSLVAAEVMVAIDGVLVPREVWSGWRLSGDEIVTVRAAVGGGDDSDVTQVVLTVVVAIAAAYTYGAVTSAYGPIAASAATTVVQIAGNHIIASVTDARQPDISDSQGDNASPTYSISGSRNRARRGEVLPLVLGEHKIVPDLGAKPYTEYAGNEQYLYQVFNFGLGAPRLGVFHIGNTPIEVYNNVEIEIAGPNAELTLFPTNVDTTDGGDLTPDAGWITRTTSQNTTEIGVDIAGRLYKAGRNGTEPLSVEIEGQYREVGTSTWHPLLESMAMITADAYWSRGYWDNGEWIQVGYDDARSSSAHTDGGNAGTIQTSGRWWWQTTTIQLEWRWRTYAERMDEAPYVRNRRGPRSTYGHKAPDPAPPREYRSRVDRLVLQHDSTAPVRRTQKQRVPKSQYEVRLRRITGEYGSSQKIAQMSWQALHSYQPDETAYSGQTRVAVKMRASGQLTGVIDELWAVGSQRVAVLEDDTWVTRESRNPAWLWLYVVVGEYDADGRRRFGAGLPESRVDLESVKAWAEYCDAKSLTCDVVFDRGQPTSEMLRTIEQCGRASRTWASGKCGVIIDQPVAATSVFGMPNIVAGTFNVSYVTERLPDQIEATFINPRRGWKPDTVRVNVPGVSNPTNPARMEFMGVTDEAQAAAEANLRAADQYYHRKRISWQTDAEGLVVTRGDVVLLSHDLTAWDYSGRIVAGDTTQLTLSRPVPFTGLSDEQWLLAVRPNGDMSYHRVEAQVAGESTDITLLDPLPASPDDGEPLDWRCLYGPTETPGKKVKIVETKPRSMNRVQITAIEEVQAYYDAADGTWEGTGDGDLPTVGEISDVEVNESLLDASGRTRVMISWRLEGAPLTSVRIGRGSQAPRDMGTTQATEWDLEAEEGDQITIELRPVNTPGDALLEIELTGGQSVMHTVAGTGGPPADVTGLLVSRDGETDQVRIRWQPNAGIAVVHYEIRRGPTWAGSTPVGITPDTSYVATLAQADTILVKAVNGRGRKSTNATAATVPDNAKINKIVEQDEAGDGWPGARTDLRISQANDLETAFTRMWDDFTETWDQYDESWLYHSAPGDGGVYESAVVDVGGVLKSRIELIHTLAQFPLADSWQSWDQPWGEYGAGWGWGGPDGVVSADFEIRTTNDDPNGSPTWNAWMPFTAGYYEARAVQFRITLSTSDAVYIPRLTALKAVIDVPDRELLFEDLVIPIGGTNIDFSPAFLAEPTTTVAIQNGEEGDTYKITGKDKTGMTLTIFDGAGNSVERPVDVRARAY
jgi:sulfur carrier protein ThiS